MKRLTILALTAALGSTPATAQPAPRGPEFQASTFTTGRQNRPSVAPDGVGNFVVVWTSDGQDGSGYGIFARRFSREGAPLTAREFQVNRHTTSYQYGSSLAVDAAGNFVVVWSSGGQDGSLYGVFGRRFKKTGVPLDAQEFQVNAFTTSYQGKPSVGVDGSGTFVVVWKSRDQDGSGDGIFGRRFSSTGAPLDVQEFQVNTFTTGNQQAPSVAVEASGSFVVVWSSAGQDGSGYGIFVRRFSSTGAPLDVQEFQANTFTSSDEYHASIAMDGSGNFVVVWQSQGQDGSGYGIFGRRFSDTGAPLDAQEFQVNTVTTNDQSLPSVAARESGSFVVAWSSVGQDGSGSGVFGRSFDSTGTPLEAQEFQINTFTTDAQLDPSVAFDGSGDFVVAWTSHAQDGSGDGVFGQGFACDDDDADGVCDADEIAVISPPAGGPVDCSDPGTIRPSFSWIAGSYEKFRVLLSPDPAFPANNRVTSGDALLSGTSWIPSAKKWRSACAKALAANPLSPVLNVKIFGKDLDVPKRDSRRLTESDVVEIIVLP